MKQLPNPYKLHGKNVISEKETEAQASYVAAQSLTELGAVLQGDSSLGLSSFMAIHGRSWAHTAPGLGGIPSYSQLSQARCSRVFDSWYIQTAM